MIPLYAFMQGDSMGVVVLVPPECMATTLVDAVRKATDLRVKAGERAWVEWQGHRLDGATSIAEVGIGALDRVDVRWEA